MIGGLFKSASRLAIVASAGILAGSLSAQAADLGGNCCADLEERVAELEATTARKGNRKVTLTVYGQVNKAVMWHDSDEIDAYRSEELTVYDNQAGTSRFGFRGSAKIRPDLEAGYQIEIGLNENKGTSSSGSSGAFNIRHSYFYLDDTRLGRVSIGQTSQVTDGLFGINLGNTPLTQLGTDQDGYLGQAYENTFGDVYDGARRQGIYYRSPTVAGFILGAGYSHQTRSAGSTTYFPGINSEGDVVVAAETTPSADDSANYWEVALRYAGEFNGIRIAAGIGYRNEDLNDKDGTENDVWLGSASTLHVPTGLFLSGGYGEIDSNVAKNDQRGYWLIAGLQKNFFGPGATTFYGEYGNVKYKNPTPGTVEVYEETFIDGVYASTGFANNPMADRLSGDYWGLGIVQTVDAAAMDLYLQYRRYSLDGISGNSFTPEDPAEAKGDVTGASDRNTSVVKAGAIIRF
ncbi:porin [Leptospira interrogans]